MSFTPEVQEKMLKLLQGMRREQVGLSGSVKVSPIFRYEGWRWDFTFLPRRGSRIKEFRKLAQEIEFGWAEEGSLKNTRDIVWEVPKNAEAYLGFTLRDSHWEGLLYESRSVELSVRPGDLMRQITRLTPLCALPYVGLE